MKIETCLDHQAILANQARPVFLAVRLVADTAATQRPVPAAFALVLDRSGSMAGAPLDHARQAAALVIKHLRPADQLALVIFDDEAQTVFPLSVVGNKAEVSARIGRISDGGSTNLSAGWLLGRDELRRAPAGTSRRLLLLSDGQLNCGIVEPLMVRQLASAGLEKDGIRTSCLGFGDDYNEDLMADLARATNGAFYDADSPEKLPAIFTAELDGLQKLAAQNVRLRLKKLDFCDAYGPLGEYPFTPLPDGRIEFALGDLVAGEERVACFGVEVLPLPVLGGQPVVNLEGEPLLGLEVVYDELTEAGVESRTFTQTIRIQGTQDPGEVKLNGEVVGWVAWQRAGKALQEATRRMDAGQVEEAHQGLAQEVTKLREYGPAEAVAGAVQSIEDVERRIAEAQFDGRDRKAARYASASFQKMSSADMWCASAPAPSFKKPRRPRNPPAEPPAQA